MGCSGDCSSRASFPDYLKQLAEFLLPFKARSCLQRRLFHSPKSFCVSRNLPDAGGQLRRVIRIRGNGKPQLFSQRNNIAGIGRYGDDGLPSRENSVHFARNDDTLQAAFHGDQVRIGRGKHRRNFATRKKRKEANVRNIRSSQLKALALSTVTYEYQANVFCCELAGPFQKGVPCTVKTQVAGVQQNELEIAANGADYFRICRRRIYREVGAVADDQNSIRSDALGNDALSHVFPENDHPGGAAQSPTMQAFPDTGEQTRFDDRAADGHVRIHVANVVQVWFAFEQSEESADDALEGRIGHCENYVTGKKQRARDGRENVAQVIDDPLFHV